MSPYNATVVTTLIADAVKARGRGAQTGLANDVGVRVQTVNKWVKHQTTPAPELWPRIEQSLNMDPGTLALESGWLGRAGAVDRDDLPATLAVADEQEIVEELVDALLAAGATVRPRRDIDFEFQRGGERWAVEVKSLGAKSSERQRIMDGLATCLLFKLDHQDARPILYLTREPSDQRWRHIAADGDILLTSNYDEILERALDAPLHESGAVARLGEPRDVDFGSFLRPVDPEERAAADRADVDEQQVTRASRPTGVPEEPEHT